MKQPHDPPAHSPLMVTAGLPLSPSTWGPRGRLVLVAAALGACAVVAAATRIDIPVSSTLVQLDLPGDLAKAIDLSEVFGHSLGAVAILGTVLWLAPTSRPIVWIAVMITLASGVASNGMKSLFVRVRPHSVNAIRVAETVDSTNVSSQAMALDQRELVAESVWDSRQRSFPSGHAATAWGLAIGLSLAFPRGVVLFVCFATLASVQRITSGAHFPTDVLAGAAIAFGIAACLLSLPPLRKLQPRVT